MKSILLFTFSMLLAASQLVAQQYTAAGYWKMENDPVYLRLVERERTGDSLSMQEKSTLMEYKAKLIEYFDKMPDIEKSEYYRNRSVWSAQPGAFDRIQSKQETDVFSGERSMYTQYLLSSGLFGLFYGGALVAIFEMESGGAVGIPLLTAGASVLIPVLSLKDKYVPYNALSLSIHGKLAGALQGAALGVLITGEEVDEGKLILAMATASSIAMGRIGYSLGKNKPWSEGQASLYSYYGIIMPLEGIALCAAFESESPRLYGLSSLAFGAGGYLLADHIGKRNDFTRGDIIATGTFAALNGLLGFSILSDVVNNSYDADPAIILLPALGTLGSSLLSHTWLRDSRFTTQQGRNIALATAGGSAIGLGTVAIFSPESATPYYIVSYLAGMTTYSLMVKIYKNSNALAFSDKEDTKRWNVNLMPQNIFLNNKIAPYAFSNPGRRIDFLPAFSASLRF